MPLITPKTDWIAGNSVGFSDMNRIEGNILYLQNENKTINGTNTYTGASTFNSSLEVIGLTTVSNSGITSSSASIDFLKALVLKNDSISTEEANIFVDINTDSSTGSAIFAINRNINTSGTNKGLAIYRGDGITEVNHFLRGTNTHSYVCAVGGNFVVGAATDNGSDRFQVVPNDDISVSMGRLKIGSPLSDFAVLSHYDYLNTTDYAFAHRDNGSTIVNCVSGGTVSIWNGGSAGEIATFSGGQIDFLKPIVMQVISGVGDTLYRATASNGSSVNKYFAYNNSDGDLINYVALVGILDSSTAGSESGSFGISVNSAGSFTRTATFSGSQIDLLKSTVVDTDGSVLWEGVNTETEGTLNVKYSSNASSTSGPSIAFINDAGQFSTRDPYTSSAIKSKHYSSANSERQSSLEFYTHSGGAAGSGSLTKTMEVYHDKVVFEKNIEPTDTPTEATWTTTTTIPRGIYDTRTTMAISSSVLVEKFVNGAWSSYYLLSRDGGGAYDKDQGLFIISSGSDTRVSLSSGTSFSMRYLKY